MAAKLEKLVEELSTLSVLEAGGRLVREEWPGIGQGAGLDSTFPQIFVDFFPNF